MVRPLAFAALSGGCRRSSGPPRPTVACYGVHDTAPARPRERPGSPPGGVQWEMSHRGTAEQLEVRATVPNRKLTTYESVTTRAVAPTPSPVSLRAAGADRAGGA